MLVFGDDVALVRLMLSATRMPSRSAAAIRASRARQRRRSGRAILRVEVDHDEIVLALLRLAH
jgi:hypothetical protein